MSKHSMPLSRTEAILQNMLGEDNVLDPPQSRVEELLTEILENGGSGSGAPGKDGVTPNITMTASVDGTSGTPSVNITKGGTEENPTFNLAFKGLKGASGDGTNYDDTEIKAELTELTKSVRKVIYIDNSEGIENFGSKMQKAFENGNCDVYIKKGDYIYTNAFVDAIKGNNKRGVPIGNGCNYYFETGARIICEYTGDNGSWVRGMFSPLDTQSTASDYGIYNADIIGKNILYALHDEANASVKPYRHLYKNCKFEVDNTDLGENSNVLSKALGGGLGMYAEILVEDCTFKTTNPAVLRGLADASYHTANGTSVQYANIVVKNSWFEHIFRVENMQTLTTTPSLIYTNNSSANELTTANNWNVKKWDNEVRSASAVAGKDGKSAYQIAVDNGFNGTEEQWLASLKGADGTSYDDAEIKAEIADIWKTQGQLGAKNLIPYPYAESNVDRNGIAWVTNNDGSIVVNGQIESGKTYSFLRIQQNIILAEGVYLLTNTSTINRSNAHAEIRMENWDGKNYVSLAHVEVGQTGETFTITTEMADAIKDTTKTTCLSMIIQVNNPNEVFNDLTIYPMLRLASDTDDTWQPPTKTNKELSDEAQYLRNSVSALQASVGNRLAYGNATSGDLNNYTDRYWVWFADGSNVSNCPNSIDWFRIIPHTSANRVNIYGQTAINANTGDIYYRHTSDNGTTWEEWQKYGESELNDAIADVYKVMGETGSKNLNSFPYYMNSQTINGVTFTVNGDGSVTANGTTNAENTLFIIHSTVNMTNSLTLPSGTYILSGCPSSTVSDYYLRITYGGTSGQVIDKGQGATFTRNEDTAIGLVICIPHDNYTIDNVTFYPMIRHAEDTDDTWQPYVPTNRELFKTVVDLDSNVNTKITNLNNLVNVKVTHENITSGNLNDNRHRFFRYYVYGSSVANCPNNIDDFLVIALGRTNSDTVGQYAINANTGESYYRHTPDNGTTWTEWNSTNSVSNSKSSGNGVSDFDVFCDNIDIDYAYDSDTKANYTVIRVYKNKFDGTKQVPFVRYKKKYSCLEIAEDEGWFLTMTAGLFKPKTSTHEPDGVVIENGAIINNDVNEIHYGSYPLIIDADGNLDYAQPEETGEDILTGHPNIVSAVGGWGPLIVNYKAVDFFSPLLGYDANAQRQIIGQFGNGDYCIVTCDGRNYNNSDGWTVPEAITICKKLGLKFAYNLDGGGSVETVVGKKQLNIIYENEKGRQLPTFLVFNGKTSFSDTPISKRLIRIVPSVTEKTLVLGETVSEKDYSVMAQYSDGTSKELGSSEYKTNMSAVDFKTVGEYYVQFEYSEDGITKTATSVINIVSELPSKTLDSISATKTTTTYNIGATVETSDIAVTASYADGTTSDVTNLAVINASNINISEAGTYSIDILYTEDSITKTTSVSITIKEAADASFTPDVVFKHGFSLDADNTDPNATYFKHTASVNNTRGMGYVTTENPAYINKVNGDLLGYLIPIPPTATKVVVNSKVQSAIRLWDSNFKDIYNPGYAAAGANEVTFNAGEAAYLSVQFKSTASTNFTNGYSVVFE